MTTFTPRLPEHWIHKIGLPDIEIHVGLTWEEDTFSAEWNDWWIWIDGGKGMTIWQVSLVEPGAQIAHVGHRYMMRDFLDTADEVQAWIDRATVIAARIDAARKTEMP